FSSRRRHTRSKRDWSSDVCSSDLINGLANAHPRDHSWILSNPHRSAHRRGAATPAYDRQACLRNLLALRLHHSVSFQPAIPDADRHDAKRLSAQTRQRGVFSARLRHHAFFTPPTSSTVLDTVTADRRTTSRDHRAGQRRAQGRALAHTPSGKLDADGAWATSATRPRRTIP